jgi:hypothetical protein
MDELLTVDVDLMENNDIHFNDPSIFTEKINTLKQQLPAILSDFKKTYISYKRNPGNPEYEQAFENIKANLNTISSQVFTISNDIDANTDDINKKLLAINILIKKEKERNEILKKRLNIVERNNNKSSELISNYKEMYDSEYLRNWGIFLSIIIALTFISKVYKKPV